MKKQTAKQIQYKIKQLEEQIDLRERELKLLKEDLENAFMIEEKNRK